MKWLKCKSKIWLSAVGRGQAAESQILDCDKISLNKIYMILSLYFSLLYAPPLMYTQFGKNLQLFPVSEILNLGSADDSIKYKEYFKMFLLAADPTFSIFNTGI